jgi:hypothetical protein
LGDRETLDSAHRVSSALGKCCKAFLHLRIFHLRGELECEGDCIGDRHTCAAPVVREIRQQESLEHALTVGTTAKRIWREAALELTADCRVGCAMPFAGNSCMVSMIALRMRNGASK